MRILTYTLFIFFLLPQLSLSSQDNIELKINLKEYNATNQILTVSLDVKSDHKNLMLAGQNFRLFYTTDVLRLDMSLSSSSLPKGKYSPMILSESVTKLDASEVGQLGFDDNLGFINVAIDLNDLKSGGIRIDKNNQWHSLATISFRVIDLSQAAKIVWARQGTTDQYATAFVSVAKWNGPMNTESLLISDYHDFNWTYTPPSSDDALKITYTLSPNPSADFIQLIMDKASLIDQWVEIMNTNGQLIRKISFPKGSTTLRVDVAELSSANYLISVLDHDRRLLFHETVAVLH